MNTTLTELILILLKRKDIKSSWQYEEDDVVLNIEVDKWSIKYDFSCNILNLYNTELHLGQNIMLNNWDSFDRAIITKLINIFNKEEAAEPEEAFIKVVREDREAAGLKEEI